MARYPLDLDLSRTFVAFFALISIASATVNPVQYSVAVNLRYVLIAVVLALISKMGLAAIRAGTSGRDLFAFGCVLLGLYAYALTLSIAHGGFVFFGANKALLVFLLISFLYGNIIFMMLRRMWSDPGYMCSGTPVLSAYFLVTVGCVLAFGGLEWSFPPVMKFQTPDGQIDYYSQGFTKFCAMGGIYFFAKANQDKSMPGYLLAMLFFVFSLLGGARGDVLAGLLALLLLVFRRPRLVHFALLGAVSVGLFMFVMANQDLWGEITLLRRMIVISGGDLGMRDILAIQAVDVLEHNPSCALIGCGFNFFQVAMGYGYDVYPHNVFLESFITFGILAGGVVGLFSLIGAYSLYRRVGSNPFFYFFVIEYIVSMKSGSLIDFSALPVLLSFAFFGLHAVGRSLRSRMRATGRGHASVTGG